MKIVTSRTININNVMLENTEETVAVDRPNMTVELQI
jgi:hypothetical protein